MLNLKEKVKQYWDAVPCGTGDIKCPEGSREYFDAVLANRERLDPFIFEYAEFGRWKGKNILEVGCGVGSDLIRFAQSGAYVRGIDLSPKSVNLSNQRLQTYNCEGVATEADAEKIPYKDDKFDFVYSWGVLHHTPNIKKAIREIYRVTKPGGRICIMLYQKRSLVALQMYLLFGLFSFRPFRSIDDIIANYHESRGTKTFFVSEVRHMFSAFENLEIDVRITSYDLRYKRNGYLPMWVGKIIPNQLGWNMIVRGSKPCL